MMTGSRQQTINLGSSFDSFKYNIISYLQKLEKGQCNEWKALQIIEFEDEIFVGDIEKGKVVGSIMFPKKDDRHAKTFLVQVSDEKGRLKPYHTVVINNNSYEHFNFIPRFPNEEEIKVINNIFRKAKNLTYGIREKQKKEPKQRKLIRPNRINLDQE